MENTPAAAGPITGDATVDLSLQEAAELYDLALRTLGNRVRVGEIEAYKTRGPWGAEWRVRAQALEAFGYQRRPALATPTPGCISSERFEDLERQLATARRAIAAERNRAEEADRRLGKALLETGRLRAALAAEAARRVAAEKGADSSGISQTAGGASSIDERF